MLLEVSYLHYSSNLKYTQITSKKKKYKQILNIKGTALE